MSSRCDAMGEDFECDEDEEEDEDDEEYEGEEEGGGGGGGGRGVAEKWLLRSLFLRRALRWSFLAFVRPC